MPTSKPGVDARLFYYHFLAIYNIHTLCRLLLRAGIAPVLLQAAVLYIYIGTRQGKSIDCLLLGKGHAVDILHEDAQPVGSLLHGTGRAAQAQHRTHGHQAHTS